jgi:hypothetical protein
MTGASARRAVEFGTIVRCAISWRERVDRVESLPEMILWSAMLAQPGSLPADWFDAAISEAVLNRRREDVLSRLY